jgi:tRNA/tmRNA/rRNA uracil-C5-methylase (TrmA/RlmC/RlmD family)
VGLHVDDEGRIGPYAARSHRVIEVSSHPLATAAVEAAALALHRERPGRVDLVQPSDGEVRAIRRPRPAASGRRRGRRDERTQRAVPETVTERVGDRVFRVDAGGFWQVHRLAATTLHAAASEGVAALAREGAVSADGWHLDLYGGVGLFADAIASSLAGAPAVRVTSIESSPRATERAAENLADHGEAEAVTGRVEHRLAELEGSATARDRADLARGVTLLDPPRAGAGREVVERVAGLGPAAVVYVACDPVALARDVALFREHGYRMDRLRAFDLFPNSHHLESLAVLRRD